MKRFIAALAASVALLAVGSASPAQATKLPPKAVPVSVASDTVAPGVPVIDRKTGKAIGDLTADGKVNHYSARTSCPGPAACYSYIGTHEFLGTAPAGADAMTVTTSQHYPKKESGDYHTLWQISAENASTVSGANNMVEMGWRNAGSGSLCASSTNPCLFAGVRIQGAWQGYATTAGGGGFVDNPTEAVSVGTPLAITTAGAAPTAFYEYKIGRANSTKCDGTTTDGTPVQTTATLGWFIYQQNVGSTRIPGCFPDYIWTSVGETFTKINLAQSFNELASTDTNPCGDMGYGTYGVSTNPSASQDTNAYTLSSPPAGVVADWASTGVVTPSSHDPNAYRIYQYSGTRYRSGGPGFDVAGGTAAGSVGSC